MAPSVSFSLLALALTIAPIASATVCAPAITTEGTICGTNSYASKSQSFLLGTSVGPSVHSPEACALYANELGSGGFFYAPPGSGLTICQPFTGLVLGSASINPGSPFKVYDASCFKCSSITTATGEEVAHTPPATSAPFYPLGNSSAPLGTGTGFAASTGFALPTGVSPPLPGPESPAPVFPVEEVPATTPIQETSPVTGDPTTASYTNAPPTNASPLANTPTQTVTLIPIPAAPAAIQTTTGFSISTIYATHTYTISSCAPTVTICPYGSVTTERVALYTTICPYTSTYIPQPATTSIPSGYTVSTVYQTNVYTITKCPQTVTVCPYGSVTTETKRLYTTICPISNTLSTTTYTPTLTGAGKILTSAINLHVHSTQSSRETIRTVRPSPNVNSTETGVLTSIWRAQQTAPAKPNFTGAAGSVKAGVVGVGLVAGLAALLAL